MKSTVRGDVLLSLSVFQFNIVPYCSSLQVIAPEEIIDPGVDEQSVMTYLSQFPKAKLKPGAPLKPKLNPKKARAYGPGGKHFWNYLVCLCTFQHYIITYILYFRSSDFIQEYMIRYWGMN